MTRRSGSAGGRGTGRGRPCRVNGESGGGEPLSPSSAALEPGRGGRGAVAAARASVTARATSPSARVRKRGWEAMARASSTWRPATRRHATVSFLGLVRRSRSVTAPTRGAEGGRAAGCVGCPSPRSNRAAAPGRGWRPPRAAPRVPGPPFSPRRRAPPDFTRPPRRGGKAGPASRTAWARASRGDKLAIRGGGVGAGAEGGGATVANRRAAMPVGNDHHAEVKAWPSLRGPAPKRRPDGPAASEMAPIDCAVGVEMGDAVQPYLAGMEPATAARTPPPFAWTATRLCRNYSHSQPAGSPRQQGAHGDHSRWAKLCR